MKTPMSRLSGVCTSHVSAMISKVTQSACGRPGSVRVARQLVRPDGLIAPIPSQVVKDRARTPRSGTTPNMTNMTRAGSAIQVMDDWRVPTGRVAPWTGPASCSALGTVGSVVMSLPDDLIHARHPLLGRDRELEELGDVVEQLLGRGRGQRLVPRLGEDLR